MYGFMWDMWQSQEIRDNRENLSKTKDSVDSAQRELNRLRDQMMRMSLVNLAMFELVSERLGITQAQLEAKMREIDLRDGVEDGKFTAAPRACIACGRENRGNRPKCLYCGGSFE
jgi:hypothetical protein